MNDVPERALFGYYYNGGGAAFDASHFYHRGVIEHANDYRSQAAELGVGAGVSGDDGEPLGSTERYTESAITATMQGVLDEVIPLFGPGYGVGCYRSGNDGEHPVGRACDLMASPAGNMPNDDDLAHGQAMAEWLVDHAAELRVWYVIWQDRIWSTSQPEQGGVTTSATTTSAQTRLPPQAKATVTPCSTTTTSTCRSTDRSRRGWMHAPVPAPVSS